MSECDRRVSEIPGLLRNIAPTNNDRQGPEWIVVNLSSLQGPF